MSLTRVAFDAFRRGIGAPKMPPSELIASPDDVQQMPPEAGLQQWEDGPYDSDSPPSAIPSAPFLTSAHLIDKHLWVVRLDDVVYAREMCEYGRKLQRGVIKHTNLTGGAAAFSGGEILLLDEQTIVVSGSSGRYGPRSAGEMAAVSEAFRKSGYEVWSMGYDADAGRPLPFIGVTPTWIR